MDETHDAIYNRDQTKLLKLKRILHVGCSLYLWPMIKIKAVCFTCVLENITINKQMNTERIS